MKIRPELKISDGKYCDDCVYFEKLDSFGFCNLFLYELKDCSIKGIGQKIRYDGRQIPLFFKYRFKKCNKCKKSINEKTK